jgi:hypothetical protein
MCLCSGVKTIIHVCIQINILKEFKLVISCQRSQNSSVTIVSRLQAGQLGFNSQLSQKVKGEVVSLHKVSTTL